MVYSFFYNILFFARHLMGNCLSFHHTIEPGFVEKNNEGDFFYVLKYFFLRFYFLIFIFISKIFSINRFSLNYFG